METNVETTGLETREFVQAEQYRSLMARLSCGFSVVTLGPHRC